LRPRDLGPSLNVAASICASNPLRGVYHPYRLEVLGSCRRYEGTVTAVRHEEDGDYHVIIAPASGFARYLDAGNYSRQGGGIVAEIMPGQHLRRPYVGEQIVVVGTWANDRDHGWNEIHPIWAIGYGAGLVRSLPPSTPVHDASSSPGGSPDGRSSAPNGATAKCRDGTYSYSQHRSGTCSYHGGVAEWINGGPSG